MKHLAPIGHFPSGQPILPVSQADRTPKRVFVLGVYASAVHAHWTHPNGHTRIAGINPPDGTGRLFPAGNNLNGPY